jgi:hypothetical protein
VQDCIATSLSGMPKLRGNCPLSESGSLWTNGVVLKPVPCSCCKEKRCHPITRPLVIKECASLHQGSLKPLSFLWCFFSSEVFFESLSIFRGASFFIGGLF